MGDHCGGCNLTEAPWTDDEVASLNAYQACDHVHPFTADDGDVLVATRDGWIHPVFDDEVCQRWAHKFMADWSWKTMASVLQGPVAGEE